MFWPLLAIFRRKYTIIILGSYLAKSLLKTVPSNNLDEIRSTAQQMQNPKMQCFHMSRYEVTSVALKSANEPYRPSDCHLSVKLVLTFADRGVSRSQRQVTATAVISVFLTGEANFFSK
jgi:hypothetical protein